jgi:hypothetical protein
MNELSSEELQWNMQAVGVAASALGEPVAAATRCEQVTTDMAAGAAGVGKFNRGMMKGMKAVSGKMMPSVGNMAKGLETGGLPKSFILAVTDRQVHALEDGQDGGKLTAGKVLKSWDREGFVAKVSPDMINATQGSPPTGRSSSCISHSRAGRASTSPPRPPTWLRRERPACPRSSPSPRTPRARVSSTPS